LLFSCSLRRLRVGIKRALEWLATVVMLLPAFDLPPQCSFSSCSAAKPPPLPCGRSGPASEPSYARESLSHGRRKSWIEEAFDSGEEEEEGTQVEVMIDDVGDDEVFGAYCFSLFSYLLYFLSAAPKRVQLGGVAGERLASDSRRGASCCCMPAGCATHHRSHRLTALVTAITTRQEVWFEVGWIRT
jgi:hypothetical protein